MRLPKLFRKFLASLAFNGCCWLQRLMRTNSMI